MKKMKTIQKILGLLPMMAAALALTACSSEDNTIETPQTGNPTEQGEVKTIAYSVTVSGGDATTRATVDADNKTLKFAAGDKLYIASDSRDDIKGALTLKAGDAGKTSGATFEGSLTYTGADPADDLELKATLVGSNNVGIGITDGKVTGITYPTTAFCSDVNDAVEKYSLLTGNSTYAARSVTLTQGTAFLNFSLTLKDGTGTATNITVTVANDGANVSTATLATTTVGSDVMVNFVLPVSATTTLNGATVTVGSIPAISFGGTSAKVLTGKVYNVARWAPAPALGDLFYSDGCYSTTLIDGKTPIGVIAYLGTDAFSENGVTLRDGSTTLQSHGLVLCLKNVAENAVWGTTGSVSEFGESLEVSDLSGLMRSNDVSGYSNTKMLATRDNASTEHPALYLAWNYAILSAPVITTGWFLPSAQQWVKIQTGLGGLSDSDIKWQSYYDSNNTALGRIETALAKAGSGNYDSMTDKKFWLWTSTEGHSNAGFVGRNATIINVNNTLSDGKYGFQFANEQKSTSYGDALPVRTRPVLAF